MHLLKAQELILTLLLEQLLQVKVDYQDIQLELSIDMFLVEELPQCQEVYGYHLLHK